MLDPSWVTASEEKLQTLESFYCILSSMPEKLV